MDESNLSTKGPITKKRANNGEAMDGPDKKRRRIILKSDSEESGDEYKPGD